jgi:hypothetical protein
MKKITTGVLLFAFALNMTSCATIFGGRVTESQRTKPKDGEPSRKIRTFALLGDIIFFGGAGLIVDFATNAIYKPTDKASSSSNESSTTKSESKSKKESKIDSDNGSTAKSDAKKPSKKGGEKVSLQDFLDEAITPTGVTPFDQFNASSYDLAKSIQDLANEANMLIVRQREENDPLLGSKTIVTCYTKSELPENEKPCNLINKKEALGKLASILQSLVTATNSATNLINQATGLPTELTALAKSNPALVLKVPKAVKKLGETVKLLKIAVAETGNIGKNVKTSLDGLKQIKEQ